MDNIQKNENIDLEKAIEAILFAAGHPVAYEKLAEVFGYTTQTIKKKVSNYADKYNAEKRGTWYLVFEDSCQLCTREEYLPYIKEALGIRKGGNLSASSLEVLAIIAYNEPVTRAHIDLVRKIDSSYVVNSLLEKNLIEVCGRLDVPGRPNLYKTTSTFLRCFGIESLEQLPYVDIPRAKNEGEIIPLDIQFDENDEENGDNEAIEKAIEQSSEITNDEISNDETEIQEEENS